MWVHLLQLLFLCLLSFAGLPEQFWLTPLLCLVHSAQLASFVPQHKLITMHHPNTASVPADGAFVLHFKRSNSYLISKTHRDVDLSPLANVDLKPEKSFV